LFVCSIFFYHIVVFIKLGFLLLVFVLVDFHSIYARHLSGYCTDLRPCVGHAVAQLVEALRYKPEGHGFDSR